MAVNSKSAKAIIKQKIAEGSARSLALDTPRGLSGQNTSAISINNIAETLKSVNNENRQTFNQRAWHGSGMDFNKFNLEKPLPAPGIWYMAGAFTRLKTKRRPGCIKKYAKSKGLPSYQYEVDIPFIDVRPCV